MKALLKISLLLNFALLSGLLFVLAAGRTNHPSATPLVQLDNTPSAAAAAVPPPANSMLTSRKLTSPKGVSAQLSTEAAVKYTHVAFTRLTAIRPAVLPLLSTK